MSGSLRNAPVSRISLATLQLLGYCRFLTSSCPDSPAAYDSGATRPFTLAGSLAIVVGCASASAYYRVATPVPAIKGRYVSPTPPTLVLPRIACTT